MPHSYSRLQLVSSEAVLGRRPDSDGEACNECPLAEVGRCEPRSDCHYRCVRFGLEDRLGDVRRTLVEALATCKTHADLVFVLSEIVAKLEADHG
jgi:hypothetical protein